MKDPYYISYEGRGVPIGDLIEFSIEFEFDGKIGTAETSVRWQKSEKGSPYPSEDENLYGTPLAKMKAQFTTGTILNISTKL